MSTSIKISIIGAGSAQFSLGLVKDLCLTEGLAGSQVCFMDLDRERLETVHKLAARYAAEMGADLIFENTTEQSVALQHADFVINTAYVKGHSHEWAMRDIAEKHGYYYDGVQLGDYYQLRLALDIAREMEQVCPQAWLIQVANPLFNCTTLIARESDIKVCGLCHGYHGFEVIARTLGLDPDQITWQAPGFNHNIWLTHFIYQGQDAYPLLDEWIATKAEDYWQTHIQTHTHDCDLSRAAVHQYQLYGLFPVGDTLRRVGGGSTVGCTVYQGEWWLHTDFEAKKHWFGEPWGGPDTVMGRRWFGQLLQESIAAMIEAANNPQANLIETFGDTKTKEEIVPIIDALVNNNEGQFQVNVLNRGAIEGIPDNVAVEVPAVVNQKGIQALHVGALPPKLMLEAILPHWLDMERNLLAFKTGDRSILLWNALSSHQNRSYQQAVAVMEDLLAMPGHEEMDEFFNYPAKLKS
ncbi:MAG: alpha-glucosidase/alpha-galactosidase [Chloroflexota bacterium]|nr:alpha-glucosidase/alpha-galactosidase [Chloroflexota bacterium]